ncbi:MAG TPA: galactokinase [Flavobacteriaceae bacterium]|nr:galactokinase [Flavobacteriaceae bacterium]
MIISRAPFRITLAGGGTDLPAFYKKHGGVVTSMGIDKYIYVSFKRILLEKIIKLQYMSTEIVADLNDLQHSRAREALREFGIMDSCEVASMADLPARSGLGSSGSYLVSLINCLQEYSNSQMTKQQIADLACHLEMDVLNEPVGKQDQFIASYGGIHTFTISKDGQVSAQEINLGKADVEGFTQRCRIYYTGLQRDASKILKSQTKNKVNFEDKMLKILDLGHQFTESLKTKQYDRYGQLLDVHWRYKKSLSNKMTNNNIDQIYSDLKDSGLILGGKIIGAGGGGFLLTYVPKRFELVDEYMHNAGLVRIDYNLDTDGVKTLVSKNE